MRQYDLITNRDSGIMKSHNSLSLSLSLSIYIYIYEMGHSTVPTFFFGGYGTHL